MHSRPNLYQIIRSKIFELLIFAGLINFVYSAWKEVDWFSTEGFIRLGIIFMFMLIGILISVIDISGEKSKSKKSDTAQLILNDFPRTKEVLHNNRVYKVNIGQGKLEILSLENGQYTTARNLYVTDFEKILEAKPITSEEIKQLSFKNRSHFMATELAENLKRNIENENKEN